MATVSSPLISILRAMHATIAAFPAQRRVVLRRHQQGIRLYQRMAILASVTCDVTGLRIIWKMPNPEWFVDSRLPSQPRQPKPGEHVWSLRKNGRQIDCELRFHGEPYGYEVQFLHDGELAYGQRFFTRVVAMDEAENQRCRLMDEGWTPHD